MANTAISFEEKPPGPHEMERRLLAAGDTYPWLAFERDGFLVGYVCAGPHRGRAGYRWSVEVSAYVDASARRSGVARRLYAVLFDVLAAQGFCVALAGVALPNEASCRLHESVGFTPVGVYHDVGFKANGWRDVLWFERRLRPPGEKPFEPRKL